MGRRNKVASDLHLQRNKRGTPLYSKEDIREHDENLHELCRRPAAAYAPLPRWPRYPPPAPPPPELCHYEDDLECSYFRRRPRAFCNADPKRYTWMSEDEEATRMYDHYPRRPGSCLARYPSHSHYLSYSTEYLAGPCPAHPDLPPPPPPPALPPHHDVHRPKHVSFARSHTLTSFDDAVGGKPVVLARSQERLIDDPVRFDVATRNFIAHIAPKNDVLTEVCLGRKPLAPNYLSLSPRTIHRVRMVSQGAQTNGNNVNRRLMKSYSEAGDRFGVGGGPVGYPYHVEGYDDMRRGSEHEPLHRTQSEEPPRSPFLVTTPPDSLLNLSHTPATASTTDSLQTTTQQSQEPAKKKSSKYKEIFIDFEPQTVERRGKKRMLQKTMSEGEVLSDSQVMTDTDAELQEGEGEEEMQVPYYPHHLDDHDGYMEPLEKRSASRFSSTPADLASGGASPPVQEDQQEDEFHENLIYRGLFRKRSVSLEDTAAAELDMTAPRDDEEDEDEVSEARSAPPVVQHDRDLSEEEDEGVDSMEPEELVPEKRGKDEPSPGSAPERSDRDSDQLPLTQPSSLFASSDSLANDLRDHSDGIWNESQATVLQVAETEDLNVLTPSSRRKQLLMLQHQQRSSMDTEALDEEMEPEFDAQVPQAPSSPRICIESLVALKPSSAVPTPNQEVPQLQEDVIGLRRRQSQSPDRLDQVTAPSIRERVLSPRRELRRRKSPLPGPRTPDSGHDSAQQQSSLESTEGTSRGAPELLALARTDSGGKTDVSEASTCTTEDYVTANDTNNSGTDTSSRRSLPQASGVPIAAAGEGSSFESAYSVEGSGDEAEAKEPTSPPHSPAQKTPKPPAAGGSASDEEERSTHYSSSGYYESPPDEEEGYGSAGRTPSGERREWTEEEKRRRSTHHHKESESWSRRSSGKSERSSKEEVKRQKTTPPSEGKEKAPRRGKSRSRSPVQHHRRTPTGSVPTTAKKAHRDKAEKEVITPGMVRSPAMHEGFRTEDWGTLQRTTTPAHTPEDGTLLGNGSATAIVAGNGGGATSDDSSCGGGRRASETGNTTPTQQQQSPRRHRRVRESPRRKGAPGGGRSPTATQTRFCLFAQGAMSPESSRLKALSAESLRSVSPGSDSVFYSESADHSSNATTLCHHCGREVEKSLEEGEAATTTGGRETEPPDIVQPPAGFADSPEGPRNKPATSGRLYKKLEKRFRSEERSHGERRHHNRYRCDGARAKSEERGKEEKVKLRPLARSTDASMEMLRAADSSPHQSLPDLALGEGEDEDTGVYAESYKNATWIYIGDSEEMHVWQKPDSKEDKEEKSGEGEEDTSQGAAARRDSSESTGSERDFRRKYQAITHRMVHRKSSVEMYKRLASKSFVDTGDTLRQSLQDLLKLMLNVWCTESVAVKTVSAKPNECDKTVVVRRESGEFGFRIHGSRPVVVSAIEPDTPAETSGLEVGDIIISINNVNVLDASHSEVVKIAHAGSDTLELEVARTCNVLTPVVREPGAGSPLYSGYLWKLGGLSNGAKWVQRWFCLKRDNCLYYYKNDTESQPLGALMLVNYNVSRTPDSGRQHSFLLDKSGATGLHLAADNEESAMRWLAADPWLDISNRNLKLAASAVQQPDCFGYLMKLGHKWKSWKRRYCVLKDACLYFYQDGTSDGALGGLTQVPRMFEAGIECGNQPLQLGPLGLCLSFHTLIDTTKPNN
ncbi:hypothetical protein C0J52_19251 [Blattella germanica]|nr:hypothetical protein C0J52_19251 [Blattella germanica]